MELAIPPFLGGPAGSVLLPSSKDTRSRTIYNLGIRGHTSRQIAHRWQAEVIARLPRDGDGRLVFSFGANDTTREAGEVRVPLAESLQHTRSMLATAQQLFPTLMVGPPPLLEEEVNQRIASLSQHLSLVCAAMKVPYLEVFSALEHLHTWKGEVVANDGAHPRAAGYAQLAQLVEEWACWKAWLV